jgi:prolyl-tRNA synthetase
MVMADTGEDGIVECDSCAYAANLERAERASPSRGESAGTGGPLEEIATPGMRTIDKISKLLKVEPRRLIKTLIYLADGKPVAVLVPGDRDLNERKLARSESRRVDRYRPDIVYAIGRRRHADRVCLDEGREQ